MWQFTHTHRRGRRRKRKRGERDGGGREEGEEEGEHREEREIWVVVCSLSFQITRMIVLLLLIIRAQFKSVLCIKA